MHRPVVESLSLVWYAGQATGSGEGSGEVKGRPAPVVAPGEFCIAAIALDHGHIYGMCNGLTEAGARVKWVYDPDVKKVENFIKAFPEAKAAASEEEILEDPEVKLVCGAAVTIQGASDHSGAAGGGKGDGETNRKKIHGVLQRADSCGSSRFRGTAD